MHYKQRVTITYKMIMDTELAEISSFVQAIPPFDQLPPLLLGKVIKAFSICYVNKNQSLPPQQCENSPLFMIRKGALTYRDNTGELLGKYGEGDLCTVFCQENLASDIKVNTEEDTLLYNIDYHELTRLVEDYPAVINFFSHSAEQRLNDKMSQVNEDAIIASSLLNTGISQFYHTPVATIAHHRSIQYAAIKIDCQENTLNDK